MRGKFLVSPVRFVDFKGNFSFHMYFFGLLLQASSVTDRDIAKNHTQILMIEA